MKVVIAGGTGQVGTVLARAFRARGWTTTLLSRSGGPGVLPWDGKTLGDWAAAIDGCDTVINLAGRSVNCRYSDVNLQEMLRSRVDSATIIGEAIARAKQPPSTWLQMSTATIYAHRFDGDNDETTGIIGGQEPDVPRYWDFSIKIATAWEAAQARSATPKTRKVALRTAMVMSPDKGGIFDVLLRLVRFGLGGPVGGGAQFVSWIHEHDFIRAVEFLLEHPEISGPVNLASPGPLPQREFMKAIRAAWGMPIGLPATKWMAEIGAFFLRTDTELLFKSRRVVPGRLRAAGFSFLYEDWRRAAAELVSRRRNL